ncbi:MAG: omptin family outer membrane protease [Hyphomicrobium sp.]|jgi:outer membrane protease
MIGKKRVASLALAAGLAATSAALADGFEATKTAAPVTIFKGVEVEAALGFMQGEANEFVYRQDGSKLSQLVWAFDNDLVFKGGIAIRPWRWLALGGRFMTNITDGSTMDDYDWYRPSESSYADCAATGGFCHSHHPDTQLSYLSVDAYLAATFYENQWFALAALAGYKRDSQSWVAYDGPSNYATMVPGRLSISYEQAWQAAYLGMQFNGGWERWTLQGRVIGSWWAGGKDQDTHHITTVHYTEHFGESNMIGANAHIGYRLTDNWMLKAEYDLQQWLLAKGPSYLVNTTTGRGEFSNWNAAGGESITQTVLLGAVLDY